MKIVQGDPMWYEDQCAENTIRMAGGSYFEKPLTPHAEWALTLQPGDKVSTMWCDKHLGDWHPIDAKEVTVRKVISDNSCHSGVQVSLEEFPDEPQYKLDACWIQPLERTGK